MLKELEPAQSQSRHKKNGVQILGARKRPALTHLEKETDLQRQLSEAKRTIELLNLSRMMSDFSEREIEIGRLIARGLSNKEVAVGIIPEISVRTVETHRQTIMGKATNWVKLVVGPNERIDSGVKLACVFYQLGYSEMLYPELRALRK